MDNELRAFLESMETRISNEFKSVREEIKSLNDEIKSLSDETKEEFKSVREEIKSLSDETKEEFKAVRNEIKSMEERLSNEMKSMDARLTEEIRITQKMIFEVSDFSYQDTNNKIQELEAEIKEANKNIDINRHEIEILKLKLEV